jgi:2-isopropylmalate synthase
MPRYHGKRLVRALQRDRFLTVIRVVPRSNFVPETAFSSLGAFFIHKPSMTELTKESVFMKIQISDKTLCRQENSFSFKEKIEIARQLEKLCVDTIELPSIQNVKADTLLIKTIASFVKNSVISVCAGESKESLENALTALATTAHPRIRVELPVSPFGMEYMLHMKAPQILETAAELIALAKEKCQEVEFCAFDAARAEEDFLKEAITAAVNAGATIITVCDSAAEMMPDSFGEFVAKIKVLVPENVTVGVCACNKNGLAAANAIIAIKNGARIIKTNVGGEEIDLKTVAEILRNCGRAIGFDSGVKYTEMHRIIKQINWIILNAKNEKSAVTVVEPDRSGIHLDSNDDKDAVAAAVLKLGYDLSDEDITKVYEEVMRVAASKMVNAKELDAIVASVALQVPPTYKLVSYVINSGNIITASAQITLERDGEKLQGICIGDGPVDAAFLAIEQIIGRHYELDNFQIQSVTEGKEAMGSAVVKLRSGGKLYSGTGISTDILGASIRAFLSAVNKIVYEEAL